MIQQNNAPDGLQRNASSEIISQTQQVSVYKSFSYEQIQAIGIDEDISQNEDDEAQDMVEDGSDYESEEDNE